ncbi:MAG TPA: mechanosensitive ion channel family protein [Candidatus Kapabacteria bacterium]|nr:mechanosensitive ion channel family protein [Candidatus Kapabacteria bacterium]
MQTGREIEGVIYIVSAIVIGFVAERYLLKILVRRSETHGWRFFEIVLRALGGLIITMLVLITIRNVVELFPITEGKEETAYKVIKIIWIIAVTLFLTRIAVAVLHRVLARASNKGAHGATTILVNIVKVVVAVLGLFWIFHTLGIAITPILTALGVGGLAVALALQDTLTNLFAGIYILSSDQMQIDQPVKLTTGEEGVIHDISWRTTTLRTAGGNLIVIPNSKFAQSTLTNFSLPERTSAIIIPLIVKPIGDLDRIERVALTAVSGVLAGDKRWEHCECTVQFTEQTENGLRVQVIIKPVLFDEQADLKHRSLKEILRSFRENNIELGIKGGTAPQ